MRKFLSLLALALIMASNAFAQITSADQIDESKVYTIVASRAALSQNGSELQSLHGTPTSNEYWAFVKYAGNYYLYSVAAQKFVQALPGYGSSLLDYSTSALNFVASGDASYPICLRIARWGVNTQTGTNIALNNYITADAGNKFAITEVEGQTFDASAAQNALEAAYGTLTGQIFTLVGDRGALTMTSGTLAPTGNSSNKSAYETINSNNTMQQFAFVLYKSQLYVYNVGQDKFLYGTAGSITGRDFEGTVYNILYNPTTNAFMFTYGPSLTLNNNNSGQVNLDGWISSDGGNVFTLTKVADFDDTALQAKLNTADVLFSIEDTDGNELGSATVKLPVGTLTTAPSTSDLGIKYYTTSTLKSPITVEPGVTNNATVIISGWNGPFSISSSLDDDAVWYAFNVRQTNIGLITDDGEMSVTNSYSLDDVLADDVWAFKGNNISGFSVYNKKSGLYLTKPTSDAMGTGIPCTLSSTPNTDWLVMPTGSTSANGNGAFLLYEKSDEAHKLNQYGGSTASTLCYYNSSTDAGNFFYASSPIDFVNTVISEVLENPVGLVNGFVSEESKSNFSTRYNNLSGSENLSDFTTLYYDLLDGLLKATTGWYQLENLYTSNNYVLEAAADGALVGRQTIGNAANDINTFIKYDATAKTVMIQGQYVPTWSSSNTGATLSKTGGQMSFNPITGGSCKLAFVSDEVPASNTYRNLYFAWAYGNPYQLMSWYSSDPSNCQWYMHPISTFNITMHSGEGSYWATMYAPFGLTLPEGTEAYVGVLNEEEKTITLTSIGQNVPAGTAVVLKGSSATVTATINDDATATIEQNDLRGQYLAFSEHSDDVLSLGLADGEVGFYKYTGTIGSNRAFLNISQLHSSDSKGFKFVFADDDDLTGIEPQSLNATGSQSYYDLQGRKVAAPQKGQFYIENGKVVKY